MAVPTLTARQLNRALLARQRLLRRQRIPVRDAVHAVAGLQSQEPKDPYVALWSRIAGFEAADLVDAARRREIVRGSHIRCTLHTVSAEDYVAFRPLLQAVIDRELASGRHLGGGFEMAELEPAARALLARGALSAREIGAALLPRFPRAQAAGLAHWVRNGMALAIVPTDDRWGYSRPPRFVPAEQWLGRPLATDGTLAALLLRGLSAIGPASAADLRTWSGCTGIGPALESLRPQLRAFRDESGRELFDLPEAPRPRADAPAPVRFLPEYDNTLLSHADRSRVTPVEHQPRFASKNGRRLRAVLVDGFVRAGWDWECGHGQATLRVSPFEVLSADRLAELGQEAEALLRFLEPQARGVDVRIERA